MAGPNDPVSAIATMNPALLTPAPAGYVRGPAGGAPSGIPVGTAGNMTGNMPVAGDTDANNTATSLAIAQSIAGKGNVSGIGAGGAPAPQGTSVQQGQIDLTNSITGFINGLPSASPAVAQTSAGAQMVAAGQQAVQEAQMKAAVKLQTDNAAAAARFGFTPGAPSGVNAQLSSQILDLENDMDQRKSAILKKQDTSFFDDPVGFLFNQVALPYDIAGFNTQAATVEHKLDVLHKLAIATDDQMRQNAAVDTATGSAMLAGQAQVDLGQAQLTEADAAFKAVQIGMTGASIRMSGTMDMFNAAVASNSALINAQRLVMEQQNSDIMKQHYDLDVINSNRQAEADKRAAETQGVQVQIQKLNLGTDQEKVASLNDLNGRLIKAATVYGLAPISWQQLQIMGDGPTKKMWEQAITDPNLQETGRLGYDAAASLNVANNLNLPLTPGQNVVRDKMIKAENDAVAKSGGPFAWKAMDPGSQHLAQQTSIQSMVQTEAKNIQDAGGIYSPNSLIKTLQIGSGAASLANTQIGGVLSNLANTDPRYPTKSSDILTAANNLISAGKATPAQMADEVSRIYTAIMVDNNDTRQYHRLGLPGLDPTTDGYNTAVPSPNMYGRSSPLNLASKAAVESYLTRMSIYSKSLSIPQAGAP